MIKQKIDQAIKENRTDKSKFIILDYNSYLQFLTEMEVDELMNCDKYKELIIAVVYHTCLEFIEVK